MNGFFIESPLDAGAIVADPELGPLQLVRIGSLICFSCRAALRELAAREPRDLEPDAGRHFFYSPLGLN